MPEIYHPSCGRAEKPRVAETETQEPLTKFNGWATKLLPKANALVLAGDMTPHDLARIGTARTSELPMPYLMSQDEAKKTAVMLGFLGASVTSGQLRDHPGLKDTPEKGFDGLDIGEDQLPFLDYYRQLFERTETEHPVFKTETTPHMRRDSFATLVTWNGPRLKVYVQDEHDHTRKELAELPGVFPDGIRTYTEDAGEEGFFSLLRNAAVLEMAANEQLLSLYDPTLDIESPEAKQKLRIATKCLKRVHKLNQEHSKLPPEEAMSVHHFQNVFRQTAGPWFTSTEDNIDLAPSGAFDSHYLRRDLILGVHPDDYHDDVRERFPGLLLEERAELEEAIEMENLPHMIIRRVGQNAFGRDDLTAEEISTWSQEDKIDFLTHHPILAQTFALLKYNELISNSHYKLAHDNLTGPGAEEVAKGILEERIAQGKEVVVDNSAGTTGMIKGDLERYRRARKNPWGDVFGVRTIGNLPGGDHDPDDSRIVIEAA